MRRPALFMCEQRVLSSCACAQAGRRFSGSRPCHEKAFLIHMRTAEIWIGCTNAQADRRFYGSQLRQYSYFCLYILLCRLL